MSINAWQSKQCWNFTEEMVHLVMTTQGYPERKWGMKCWGAWSPYPEAWPIDGRNEGAWGQCNAEVYTQLHNGHRTSPPTAHIQQFPVQGQNKVGSCNQHKRWFLWPPEVDQQLGDGTSWCSRDQKREVWEEEVHKCGDGNPEYDKKMMNRLPISII